MIAHPSLLLLLSLFHQKQHASTKRNVFFIWMTRSLEQLVYLMTLLLDSCSACMIFYTGPDAISAELQATLALLINVRVYVGRPRDLSKVISWLHSWSLRSERKPEPSAMQPTDNLDCGLGLLDEQDAAAAGDVNASTRAAASLIKHQHSDRLQRQQAILNQWNNRSYEVGRLATQDGVMMKNDESTAAGLELPINLDVVLNHQHDAAAAQLASKDHADGWCVLYCGAIKTIRTELKELCRQAQFHYIEESFSS